MSITQAAAVYWVPSIRDFTGHQILSRVPARRDLLMEILMGDVRRTPLLTLRGLLRAGLE